MAQIFSGRCCFFTPLGIAAAVCEQSRPLGFVPVFEEALELVIFSYAHKGFGPNDLDSVRLRETLDDGADVGVGGEKGFDGIGRALLHYRHGVAVDNFYW